MKCTVYLEGLIVIRLTRLNRFYYLSYTSTFTFDRSDGSTTTAIFLKSWHFCLITTMVNTHLVILHVWYVTLIKSLSEYRHFLYFHIFTSVITSQHHHRHRRSVQERSDVSRRMTQKWTQQRRAEIRLTGISHPVSLYSRYWLWSTGELGAAWKSESKLAKRSQFYNVAQSPKLTVMLRSLGRLALLVLPTGEVQTNVNLIDISK